MAAAFVPLRDPTGQMALRGQTPDAARRLAGRVGCEKELARGGRPVFEADEDANLLASQGERSQQARIGFRCLGRRDFPQCARFLHRREQEKRSEDRRKEMSAHRLPDG